MEMYGADASAVETFLSEMPGGADLLHPDLPYARGQIAWAARFEMARTLDDALARRTRCLLLNARAAMEAAPDAAAILAAELGRDEAWQAHQVEAFRTLAAAYLP